MALNVIFLFLIRWLYRFFVMPILLMLALLLSPLNWKLRWGLKRRMQPLPKPGANRPIWFHCASGEFEYAKSVIRKLKERFPSLPVLVTYYSPSYYDAIENFPGVDISLPLPLDLPGPIRTFVKRFRPLALLIARSDLWPEMLARTKSEGIPSLLFSCTRPPLSFWQKVLAPIWSFLYSPLTHIQCVSEQDRKVLEHFYPATQITVTGDSRFDQVSYRLENPKPLPFKYSPDKRAVLVCGSIWAEDQHQLFGAYRELVADKKLRVIIVAHEPTVQFLQKIKGDLTSAKLDFCLMSEITDWTSDVLIVDRPGYLAEIYTLGDFAFVGGSFRRKVHSVMEPLAAGLITIVGPHHKNNREACTFQKITIREGLQAVIPVENGSELNKVLTRLINQPSLNSKAVIADQVRCRKGASDCVMDWLALHLDKQDQKRNLP